MAKVLVVDDDPDVRKLIRAMLDTEGHAVIEAANSAEAVTALDANPDAAFIDVAMPEETGVQFLLRLRQHPRLGDLPATFVTAYADRAAPFVRAGIAGARVVCKPFRKQALLSALDEMLSARRRRASMRVRLTRDAIAASVAGGEPAFAKNLSLGGLFVLNRQRRPVGEVTPVTVHFRGQGVTVTARVTHVQADGVGFAFLEPTREFQRFVAGTLKALLADGTGVDDRRGSDRVKVSAALVFSQDGVETPAQLADLSPTGAFVVTEAPPPVGTKTFVYFPGFAFSDGKPEVSELRGCQAEVVRHGKQGFGCRFVDASAEFKMAVAELLRGERAGTST